MKKSHSFYRHADGFIYVELLVGLCLAAMIFAPAYRFAAFVMERAHAESRPPAVRRTPDDTLERYIRCAVDDPDHVPFHYHDGVLGFASSSSGGAIEDRRERVRARLFDGERWH